MALTALRNSFSGLRLRVLSALVLGPIAFAGVWFGGYFFVALIAIIALIISWEWGHLVSRRSAKLITVLGTGLSLGGIWVVLSQQASGVIGAYIVSMAILSLLLGIYLRSQDTGINALWSASGVFYLCLCILAMSWIRLAVPHGQWLSFWLLAVVWATDISAYAAGRLIGGPKFSPRISPQKTWSGFCGGTVMGIAASVTVTLNYPQSFWVFLIMGCVVAIATHMGDLVESAAKRRFGVKDMSRLIPGHGGLLDRIDGLTLAALVVAVLVWLREEGMFSWS